MADTRPTWTAAAAAAKTPQGRRALHWAAIGSELRRCAVHVWFHLAGIARELRLRR